MNLPLLTLGMGIGGWMSPQVALCLCLVLSICSAGNARSHAAPSVTSQQVLTSLNSAAQSQGKPRGGGGGGGGGTPLNPVNELTFTFNSEENPWTAGELVALKQAVTDIYPVAKAVYGQPAFPLTVNIRKTSELNNPGEYNSFLHEITLLNSSETDVLCHEMLHAFRDRNIIAFASFEEGMVRAAEIEIFNRLPRYDYPMGKHHSYPYDIYYEGLNDPCIGAQNGNFFAGYVSALLRYQLAGYAWGKALLENPRFFIDFNQQLAARLLLDPSVRGSEAKLIALIAGIQPTIEGKQFVRWYRQQGVLNMNPPKGYFLYNRLNQYTLDFFYRDEYGWETMLAGQPILFSLSNYRETDLDSMYGLTGNYGFVSYWPDVEGYVGRGKLTGVATFIDPSTSAESVATNISFDAVGCAIGLFGVVAEQDTGTVRITPLDAPLPPVEVSLMSGAFSAPAMAAAKGRFVATLTDSFGRSVSRQFTKDASDYFLPLSTTATSADLMVSQVYSIKNSKPGAPVTFTLTLRNLSARNASDILLVDRLPVGATVGSVVVSAGTYSIASVPTNGILTVNLEELAAGATATVTLTASFPSTATASIINSISLTASTVDPNPVNNSSALVVPLNK